MTNTTATSEMAMNVHYRTDGRNHDKHGVFASILKYSGIDLGSSRVSLMHLAEDDSFEKHYKNRFESCIKGAQLLLDTLPDEYTVDAVLQKKALASKHYLLSLQEEFFQKLKAVEDKYQTAEYQALLQQYSLRVIAVMMQLYGVDETTAIKRLSKAEEIVCSIEGRKTLVTINSMEINHEPYSLVQIEKPKAALSAEAVEEYWAIRQGSAYPDWFLSMKAFEKRILLFVLDKVKDKKELQEKFTTLSSRWRSTLGLPNYSEHQYLLFDQAGRLVSSDSRCRSAMISSRDVIDEGQSVRQKHVDHNLKLILFDALQKQAKKYIEEFHINLDTSDEISLPFLVQTLISPLNIGSFEHNPDYQVFLDKEQAIERLKDWLKDGIDLEIPNGDKKSKIIKVKVDVFSTNHPLNVGRYIDYTTTSPMLEYFQQQYKALRRRYVVAHSEHKDEAPLLFEKLKRISPLLDQYRLTIQQGGFLKTFTDARGRELFISSQEQLLVSQFCGIGYGSCISGKDRKALETIHSDAMQVFYDLYGRWPLWECKSSTDSDLLQDKVDRLEFTEIFAQIYVTRHQQCNANQNSIGAFGIKTPKMYLPTDIQQAISRHYLGSCFDQHKVLGFDDDLASNNEIKAIVKGASSSLKEEQAQIAEQATTKLMTPMKHATGVVEFSPLNRVLEEALQYIQKISNCEKFWTSHSSYTKGRPEGVQKIHEYLEQAFTQPMRIGNKDLNAVYGQIVDRGEESAHRYQATKSFYSIIKNLYWVGVNTPLFSAYVEQLKTFYTDQVLPIIEQDKRQEGIQGYSM